MITPSDQELFINLIKDNNLTLLLSIPEKVKPTYSRVAIRS